MLMRSASRLLLTALPLAAALVLSGCGDIKGADDRQWYVKAPLDEPGLIIKAEQPTAMDELGTPREMVPQSEAKFIAPARPRPPAQAPGSAPQGTPPATPQPGG
ncbi:MAG TPA: hypothetical protein VMK65_10285 [Longimicrobiales bacterium]|nr:hypothetical protein [Longimicrobiales bacterium]